MSLSAIKASSEALASEKKRTEERRRNILILVHAHLIENGYVEAAERLQHEAGSVLSKFEVADNVDIGLVLSEYEAYYEMRFDKRPKLVRKLKEGEENTRPTGSRPPRQPESSSTRSSTTKSSRPGATTNGSKVPTVTGGDDDNNSVTGLGLGVSGVGVGGSSVDNVAGKGGRKDSDTASDRFEERILKPPPQFAGDSEMRALAAVISREIYQESPNVRFDDIVELHEAKRLLSEAVQLPLQYPSLFTGLLRYVYKP